MNMNNIDSSALCCGYRMTQIVLLKSVLSYIFPLTTRNEGIAEIKATVEKITFFLMNIFYKKYSSNLAY